MSTLGFRIRGETTKASTMTAELGCVFGLNNNIDRMCGSNFADQIDGDVCWEVEETEQFFFVVITMSEYTVFGLR